MSLERIRAFNSEESTEKYPHLREDIKPIFTTVEDVERVSSTSRQDILELVKNDQAFVLNFYATDEAKKEKSIISAGKQTYVISPIDSKIKFSENYYNCQGLIASGLDKNDDEISLMTHHNPAIFGKKEIFKEFVSDLTGMLRTLNSKVEHGTLDVVMFGGDANITGDTTSSIDPALNRLTDYKIVSMAIADIVTQELGIEARIVEGPRIKPTPAGATKIYEQIALYDTENRHLHIFVRGASQNSGKTFLSSEIDSHVNTLFAEEREGTE